jgi:LPPG:FO 2-phospho-L-lactate transferase
VLDAIEAADAILIAPSNPYVSIWPILAVAEIRPRSRPGACRAVAVSPLDRRPCGQGAGRPYARADGGRHDSGARGGLLRGLIDALVVDESDPAARRRAPRRRRRR